MTTSHLELPYGFELTLAKDSKSEKEPELNYAFYVNPPKIKSLTYKGALARVFLYQKILKIASEDPEITKLLADVKEIGGSSSGSIAAVFTSLHYKDERQRIDAIARLQKVNMLDTIGNTRLWKLFQWVSSPLFLISKSLTWSGKKVGEFAARAKYMEMILTVMSKILGVTGTLVSPEGLAGLFNLLTKRGIFKGDQFQENLMNEIHQGVANAIQDILNHVSDSEQKNQIINHLIKIGLIQSYAENNVQLTKEITFAHFHELSQLPGSHFKDVFITAFRHKDRSFVKLNYQNVPDLPLHLATRMAITIPYLFQTKSYQGNAYLDGGIADNFPIRHSMAQSLSPLEKFLGIHEDLSRLGLRIDYKRLFHKKLWIKKADANLREKIIEKIRGVITKMITGGVDYFSQDDVITEIMKERFPQRTIELHDFGLKLNEFNIDDARRAEYCDALDEFIKDYFNNHKDEKVTIINYKKSLADDTFQDSRNNPMPHWMCVQMLRYLQDKTISNQQKFHIPEMSSEDLEALRIREIQRLNELPVMKSYKDVMSELQAKVHQGSTANILKKANSFSQNDIHIQNRQNTSSSASHSIQAIESPQYNYHEENKSEYRFGKSSH